MTETTHTFRHVERERLTDQERAKLFLDSGGKCAGCARKIRPGEVWHADHVIALENGGDNSRWQVLCKFCHKPKTAADHAQAAKGRDIAVRHYVPTDQRRGKGGKPLPGTKRSGWRHKVSGQWEKR